MIYLHTLDGPDAIREYIASTSDIPVNLGDVTSGHLVISGNIEVSIYKLDNFQQRTKWLMNLYQNSQLTVLGKASVLAPYYPVGDDKMAIDEFTKSIAIANQILWKDIKNSLKEKHSWVVEQGLITSLDLRVGNHVVIPHNLIPNKVRDENILSIAQ